MVNNMLTATNLVICLNLILSVLNVDSNLRQGRQAKCDRTIQFQCKSGECINEENLCDGKSDCTDHSDETTEACSPIHCPAYTYRCKYGACVSRNALCNGISECFDNSDEDPQICQNQKVEVHKRGTGTVSGSCSLPTIQNGIASILMANSSDEPGKQVGAGTVIEVSCSKGYVVGPNQYMFCNSGTWHPDLRCERSCPPLVSTPTMEVGCHRNGMKISCNEPVEHTTADFKCMPFHEFITSTKSVRYCFEGSWDQETPTCKPVCGQKRIKANPLIIGGTIVERANYPWTIGLYRKGDDKFSQICSATLINQRVIVTAAHCVADRKGNKKDENLYRAAAGKYYLAYDDPRDTDAEFSEIQEIFIHDRYRGSNLDYESDIAVLVTKKAFNITASIQNICVDWNLETDETQLLGKTGIVTGWGYTADKMVQSEVMKELFLPYVDYTVCFNGVPDEAKRYVRQDKMCAGYLNTGVGVCTGDAGAGLVFKNSKNNRFYLRGVLSTAPQKGGNCDQNQYAFYTKVSSYIDFISRIVRQYGQ